MKTILFPFSSFFSALSLKRRWWHRMFAVLFFAASVIIAGVETLIIYQNLSSYSPIRTLLTAYERQLQLANTSGIDFDFLPSTARSVPMMSPDGKHWWIPADQVALASLRSRPS